MRISRIKVNNFKSLVDFDLPMEKFTCLIGLNGSGKSTVLQFVDFLGQLMQGEMDRWCRDRDWLNAQLVNANSDSALIQFHVTLLDDIAGAVYEWSGIYDSARQRYISEALCLESGRLLYGADRNGYSFSPVQQYSAWPINFKFQGSLLSQLLDEQLPEPVRSVRDFLRSAHSLDAVTPDSLRQPSGTANGSLGHGGRNLAAYLSELPLETRDNLTRDLQKPYPPLLKIHVLTWLDGLKTLAAWERNSATEPQKGVVIPAAHMNDGMLPVLAFLAELESKHEFIIFDEIENGINPEIVEFLVDKLVNARQQVMVTTHSPMILNYLDDEVAKKSVVYLYKTAEGHTKAIPFFDIPSMAEKLKVMGPGEVFVDTKLSALADEIAALPKAGAP